MRLYGLNVLTGMAVTAKHFVKTYVEDFKYWFGSKERQASFRNKADDIGSFTVQYPEQQLKIPERFRVLPILIYEENGGDVRCTACGICAKVCPPQCIWIVQTKEPATGKPKPKVTDFFIDMDVCMNCGFCSEFCPFDAIKMDHQFELSNYERKKSHVYDMQDLLVSTDYYAKTHPRAWAKELQVKEEEEKKKKAKEAAAAIAAKKKAEEAAKAAAAAAANPDAAAAPAPAAGATPAAAATPTAPKPAAPTETKPAVATIPAAPAPVAPKPAAPEATVAPKPAAPAEPKPAVSATPAAPAPVAPKPAAPEAAVAPKPPAPAESAAEEKPAVPATEKKEDKPS